MMTKVNRVSSLRIFLRERHLMQWRSICLLLTCALGAFSCAEPPPKPPEDLEALLGFLFEHTADEDPSALALGIEELHAWFQDEAQLEAAREGFLINTLDLSRVTPSDFPLPEMSNSNLQGVSVVTKSPYCVKSIVGLLTWEKFGELLDSFETYKRVFDLDSTCMVTRDCLMVTAESETRSSWAGLIGITTSYHIDFRWVYTEVGWALVHRFWLKQPALGDSFGVKMNANYYVGVTLPDSEREVNEPSPALISAANGAFGLSGDELERLQQTLSQPGSLRIHANWFDVDTGDIPLEDSMIANLLVQQQKNDSESHDSMITSHSSPGRCATTESSSSSSMEVLSQ